MAQVGEEDTKGSLERIKKQLNAGSGSVLLQGTLLKRSETLRKWNQRWFTLDPATGKMEYRFQRGDPTPRGLIYFDADSTITVSPLNIQGDRKYDGCCFYIGTPQKKEFFLCAETPAAARAWVATLRAAALVLKAHKEAVNSLSGNGRAKLGTVAAVVAAANSTAREAIKDVQVPMRPSSVTSSQFSQPAVADTLDNGAVLKETLRVKDEELNQLARDLRARDLTIKELADRLSETADAAESAASAVHSIDKERRVALSEVEHLRKELQRAAGENKAAEERVLAAFKTRDLALQEAHRWRVELGKAREQCVIMEAAVQRGHEHVRQLKIAHEQELARIAQAQDQDQAQPHAQETRAIATPGEAGVQEEQVHVPEEAPPVKDSSKDGTSTEPIAPSTPATATPEPRAPEDTGRGDVVSEAPAPCTESDDHHDHVALLEASVHEQEGVGAGGGEEVPAEVSNPPVMASSPGELPNGHEETSYPAHPIDEQSDLQ